MGGTPLPLSGTFGASSTCGGDHQPPDRRWLGARYCFECAVPRVKCDIANKPFVRCASVVRPCARASKPPNPEDCG
eukprot:2674535-Pyramimonas_sp.AAC.1